jgi:hypothetical protein
MAVLKHIVSLTHAPRVARGLEIAIYLAAGAWLFATFWMTAMAMRQLGLVGLDVVVFPMLAILIGAIGVTVLATWAELYGQRARDLGANAVFEALQRGQTPRPYSLYLRPFASTNVIGGIVGVGMLAERIELEAQIERATRRFGPLVALGAPLEHIGAGRIQVEEEAWRGAISALMAHAQLIIMLPSSHGGTLQEIAMILGSDLIKRTVMIDPPNLRKSSRFDPAAEWAKVRETFRAASYELPSDMRNGALLYFGGRRQPLLKERLDIDAEDRIERLFRRLLKLKTSKAFAHGEA